MAWVGGVWICGLAFWMGFGCWGFSDWVGMGVWEEDGVECLGCRWLAC